jgi:hypothetical protein
MTLNELAEWIKEEYAILSEHDRPTDVNRRSRAHLEGRLRTLVDIELMCRNGQLLRHSPKPKPPQIRKKRGAK